MSSLCGAPNCFSHRGPHSRSAATGLYRSLHVFWSIEQLSMGNCILCILVLVRKKKFRHERRGGRKSCGSHGSPLPIRPYLTFLISNHAISTSISKNVRSSLRATFRNFRLLKIIFGINTRCQQIDFFKVR